MKLAIKNSDKVADIAALKEVNYNELLTGAIMYVEAEESAYVYYSQSISEDAVVPNAIGEEPEDNRGRWHIDSHAFTNLIYVVEDSYNFTLNEAEDITSIELLHKQGKSLLSGGYVGFKDWKALRDSVKDKVLALAGSNLSNYTTNLTEDEQQIGLIYLPTLLVNTLGYSNFVSYCNGSTEAEKIINAQAHLDNYLDETQGNLGNGKIGAFNLRWKELSKFIYGYLGREHGLKLSKLANNDGVNYLYTSYGIIRQAVDYVGGMVDWIDSTTETDFATTGLKKYILDNSVPLPEGVTLEGFTQSCIDIIELGKY